MSAKDVRAQQLRSLFSTELEERVRALNDALLRLEHLNRDDPGATAEAMPIYDALFREAHSLKGASRMVQLGVVEQLAHALESALSQARAQQRLPAQSWFDALYRAIDLLGELDRAAPDQPPPSDLDAVLAALRGDASEAVPAARPAEAPPSGGAAVPPPLGGSGSVEGSGASRARADSVRVATDRLDALVTQSGELTVTHIRVAQRLAELRDVQRNLDQWRREWRSSRRERASARQETAGQMSSTSSGRGTHALLGWLNRAEQQAQTALDQITILTARLREDAAHLGLVARTVQDEVMAARLVPFGSVAAAFERAARDVARATGREVRLVIEGAETGVDRKVLDHLRDPLMHLLRNAIDHGIEPPEIRARAGKPREGTVRIGARQRGDTVEIVVGDDGTGLDPAVLRDRAVAKGLLSPDQAAVTDDASALQLVFLPGFSTRDQVTETSGRGVGLDVVREHVQRLNGTVHVASVPGRGAEFTLSVPLTLATTRAILVEQGGQLFAVPSATVERTGRVKPDALAPIEGRQAVELGGEHVIAAQLGVILEQPTATSADDTAHRPYFVLQQGGRRAALLVDRLAGEQEIVVKPLGWPLKRVRNVAGSTMLASGDVVVILNPTDLAHAALQRGGNAPLATATASGVEQRRTRRVLVVDDSLTTRTLERSILEAAGYDVLVAADGVEALTVLRAQPVDLVVSDVQMPRLDGFGLTGEMRRDERLRQIPVVLVTSLDAQEYREQGAQAGADAYIVKGAFDQDQLLETVGRLL